MKYSCQAKDLYCSPLFKKSYAFAKKVGSDFIYILSAKYGLLRDDTIIEPYDLTLLNMSKSERILWSDSINSSLRKEITEGSSILVLAGQKYMEFLDMTGFKIYDPMKGLKVIERLAYLNGTFVRR